MRQLDVYLNIVKAGTLTEEMPGKGYSFHYDNEFLSSELPAISVTLPKSPMEYKADTLFPFFSNMVPEGANRRVICRQQRIDENDIFGLLTAMAGKDFIGAVNIKLPAHD